MEEIKARIKDGATVGQDHGFHKWTDNGEIFDVGDFNKTRKKLRRDGYGSFDKEDSYGNGCLFVDEKDLIPVSANDDKEKTEMTNKELFEKLKRDGECWQTGEAIKSRCFGKDPDTGESNSCISIHDPADQNPDFSTPDGFFWLWERAQEKEWWSDMIWHSSFFDKKCTVDIVIAFIEVIRPARFTEALKEYLGEE